MGRACLGVHLVIAFPSSRTHELPYLLAISTPPLPLFLTSAVSLSLCSNSDIMLSAIVTGFM